MTNSKREQVLDALQVALGAVMPNGAALLARNDTLPTRIASGGVAILRDGDPGEPEVTLSPLEFHYQHRAEIDILVDSAPAARDAAFDALARAVGAAIDADRTLGGRCDWIEGVAPAPLAIPIEGAETLKAATITVVLHYSAADTLL
ncbi:acyl-CoA transferase [Roseinatronobacter sp.]|uniref:acyl-CoA transferase n=1 Tax=Roseinatronobacter sp. TaxID=1945755 RepID=UPI003F6EBE6D